MIDEPFAVSARLWRLGLRLYLKSVGLQSGSKLCRTWYFSCKIRLKSFSSASVTTSATFLWSGTQSSERMPRRTTAPSRWQSSAVVKPYNFLAHALPYSGEGRQLQYPSPNRLWPLSTPTFCLPVVAPKSYRMIRLRSWVTRRMYLMGQQRSCAGTETKNGERSCNLSSDAPSRTDGTCNPVPLPPSEAQLAAFVTSRPFGPYVSEPCAVAKSGVRPPLWLGARRPPGQEIYKKIRTKLETTRAIGWSKLLIFCRLNHTPRFPAAMPLI